MVPQVEAIQADVTKQQRETEDDLAKAEPALQAANAALNTLNRVKESHRPMVSVVFGSFRAALLVRSTSVTYLNVCLCSVTQLNLTELRTFPNPPAIVTNVSAAVLVLLAPQGRVPKDRSWKASKIVMSKVTFHPDSQPPKSQSGPSFNHSTSHLKAHAT